MSAKRYHFMQLSLDCPHTRRNGLNILQTRLVHRYNCPHAVKSHKAGFSNLYSDPPRMDDDNAATLNTSASQASKLVQSALYMMTINARSIPGAGQSTKDQKRVFGSWIFRYPCYFSVIRAFCTTEQMQWRLRIRAAR